MIWFLGISRLKLTAEPGPPQHIWEFPTCSKSPACSSKRSAASAQPMVWIYGSSKRPEFSYIHNQRLGAHKLLKKYQIILGCQHFEWRSSWVSESLSAFGAKGLAVPFEEVATQKMLTSLCATQFYFGYAQRVVSMSQVLWWLIMMMNKLQVSRTAIDHQLYKMKFARHEHSSMLEKCAVSKTIFEDDINAPH